MHGSRSKSSRHRGRSTTAVNLMLRFWSMRHSLAIHACADRYEARARVSVELLRGAGRGPASPAGAALAPRSWPGTAPRARSAIGLMRSERLRYRPVEPADLEAFHRLVEDEHVRRYMMDGEVFPRAWSEQHIRKSQALFERRGVGTWLAYDTRTGDLVGFCGFWIPPTDPDPQLIYAMFARFTGRGLATEMARASIEHARGQPGFDEIVADVDEVNAASLRVLEKVGFERIDVRQAAFGNLLVLRLAAGRSGGAGEPRSR